ncbi:MAG: hypothetical protein ACRCV7_00040 [Culicoidibacterales bacterium]
MDKQVNIKNMNNKDILSILKLNAKNSIKSINFNIKYFGLSKNWNKDRKKLLNEFLKVNEVNKDILYKYWFVVPGSGIEYLNKPPYFSDEMYLKSDLELMFTFKNK